MREEEAARLAMQRPGDAVDRDVDAGPGERLVRRDHLTVRDGLEVAVELLVQRIRATGASSVVCCGVMVTSNDPLACMRLSVDVCSRGGTVNGLVSG